MSAATTVREVAEQVWQRRVAREPYFALREGLPVLSIPADSLEEAEQDAAFAKSRLATLADIDRSQLMSDSLLTCEFLEDELGRTLNRPQAWWRSFPVTPYLAFTLAWYVQHIFQPFKFTGAEECDRYRSLLHDFAGAVQSMRTRLDAQARRGWRVPKPALPGVLTALRGFKQFSLTNLAIDPDRLKLLDGARAGEACAQAERIVTGIVRREFDELIAFVEGDYASAAPSGVGLHLYPDGEEAYAEWIRHHLTFEMTPEQLHAKGREEIARLSDAMAGLRAELGFKGTEQEYHEQLRATGRMYAKSPAEVEARYRRCIERMSPLLSRGFRVLPKAPYDVKRLELSAEAGMSFGHYDPPTPAQPIGFYRYNGSGLDTRSQMSAASVIYHELAPGHHFHLARQMENKGLPDIRRHAIELTVFNEGWAEYAAELAGEWGLYDTPDDRYGRLLHERFIAQRLVTDTGLNAFGWSLEQAREYMLATTLESPTQVASETLRYSTDLPAQALAYRVGFLKFMELRQRAADSLGSRFDLRDFHEAILKEGALPMPVLARHLERWARRVAQD